MNLPPSERATYRDPDEDEEDGSDVSDSYSESAAGAAGQENILPRKAAEVISSTIGNVAYAIEMPISEF